MAIQLVCTESKKRRCISQRLHVKNENSIVQCRSVANQPVCLASMRVAGWGARARAYHEGAQGCGFVPTCGSRVALMMRVKSTQQCYIRFLLLLLPGFLTWRRQDTLSQKLRFLCMNFLRYARDYMKHVLMQVLIIISDVGFISLYPCCPSFL